MLRRTVRFIGTSSVRDAGSLQILTTAVCGRSVLREDQGAYPLQPNHSTFYGLPLRQHTHFCKLSSLQTITRKSWHTLRWQVHQRLFPGGIMPPVHHLLPLIRRLPGTRALCGRGAVPRYPPRSFGGIMLPFPKWSVLRHSSSKKNFTMGQVTWPLRQSCSRCTVPGRYRCELSAGVCSLSCRKSL